ncbi:hypothetical protein [Nannocystis pusilla]|uniref:hypothetical protein n=1 Tax=Nannocystis pusilla TaxID=889268 RepID=UPI003BF55B7F
MSLYQGKPHETAFLQLVVIHHSATEELLFEIARAWSHNSGVLNAIATSPRSTRALLRFLETSASKSVAQHAYLGLLRHDLSALSERELRELRLRHGSDEGIDIGVRIMIANSSHTPVSLLLEMLQDEADIVANTARNELSKR